MRGAARRRQAGQILPFAVIALLVACLGLVAAARSAITLTDRVRAQSAADATSLAAATAYARGLNIAAASNLFELLAFILDVKHMDPNLTLTKMVMRFQDGFLAAMPAYMDGVAGLVARENGFEASITWNGSGGPDLLVRRGSAGDVLGAFGAGAGGGAGGGGGPGEEPPRFSYRPAGGGPRVEVPPQEVEEVTYEVNGKEQKRYRIKNAPGKKGGKFVRKEPAAGSSGSSGGGTLSDMPIPLVEISKTHTVLVEGRLVKAAGGRLGSFGGAALEASSQAETGGGEVFGGGFGDPSFEVRLIPVGGP